LLIRQRLLAASIPMEEIDFVAFLHLGSIYRYLVRMYGPVLRLARSFREQVFGDELETGKWVIWVVLESEYLTKPLDKVL
jgi:hypothetical protein